ncbi:50S ribosomal protein L19 [Candidatus Daviesbacteria bacterium]|nr:50S ribosomal protein L19 [Candidatus Daviesbacteria bacterium]
MISAKFNETTLNIGDTIRVHTTVVEGNKTRVQVFEGILIALNGRGENQMMTVRRIGAGNLGVERKWPLNGKSIVKIEVKKNAKKVRRSKLYYLRDLIGKRAVRV